MNKLVSFFRNFDWLQFVPTIVLVSMGGLLIYSAIWGRTEGQNLSKIKVQAIAAVIGVTAFFVMATIDYRFWESLTPFIYIFIILILLIVLFQGETIRGSTSWIRIGPAQFQPSELAKVLMLLVFSRVFSKYKDKIKNSWKYFLGSVVLVLIPTGLVILESDLGTALIFLSVWLGLVFAIGLPAKKLLTVVGVGILVSILAWLLLLQPYQKDRLSVFLSPSSDPQGSGYNVLQSLIAVGSGEFLGRGLGHGSQSQLNFLPEQHTDFIFAVLAEELGFVGGLVLLGVFSFLLWRLMSLARNANNEFGSLFCLGLVLMFLVQILINVGMNIGIMPVTGIPLPLISYGGSALISYLFALGIAQSVHINSGNR